MAPAMTTKPVAIVGGGLGGLSAALHLRRHGYDVALFEKNAQLGGRANRIVAHGFQFDTGPSLLNYPWVCRELFAATGARFEDYVTLHAVEPTISFLWPDGAKLILSSHVDRLIASCSALEPGAGPGVMAFLRDARLKYDLAFSKLVTRNEDSALRWFSKLSLAEMARLSVWRSLYGQLGKYFGSSRIREALGSYGMYLGGSPFDLPGMFTILPYGEMAYGLWLPKGGVYALVEALRKRNTELGVAFHTNAAVTRINAAHGHVRGLALADDAVFDAPIVVSNVEAPVTDARLLGHENALARRRGRANRLRFTPGVVTFYWGVRGLVHGMGHHTIFLPNDYRGAFRDLFRNGRIPSQLPFYISIASETDPDLAPRGDSTVFVLIPTPRLSELGPCDWPAVVASLRNQILDRLRLHDIDLTQDRIAHETVYTPEDWGERFGLHDGSAFGAAHTLFQVGPFRMANYAPELAGMYYTGASTTPGTGIPMVLLSGAMTAQRVTSREA